jgi:hypothetical protein
MFLLTRLGEEPKKVRKGLTIPEEKCIDNKGKNLNRSSNPEGVPASRDLEESRVQAQKTNQRYFDGIWADHPTPA